MNYASKIHAKSAEKLIFGHKMCFCGLHRMKLRENISSGFFRIFRRKSIFSCLCISSQSKKNRKIDWETSENEFRSSNLGNRCACHWTNRWKKLKYKIIFFEIFSLKIEISTKSFTKRLENRKIDEESSQNMFKTAYLNNTCADQLQKLSKKLNEKSNFNNF